MSTLNATPSSERTHIGIFGKRNAGKSSIINAITNQDLAIVSPVKGTTTDPVYKAMELLPLGPVTIIDTPGLDDEGELGLQRVAKAYQVLRKTDIALVAIDARLGMQDEDYAILSEIELRHIPFLIVFNKIDLVPDFKPHVPEEYADKYVAISTVNRTNINTLKERLAHLIPKNLGERRLIGDLLETKDLVVLVVPIDSAAPKGRLILPQQQVLRDVLEAGAIPVVCRESELATTLKLLAKPPRLVITDSQVFAKVQATVPDSIPLTSFSILFARYKGDLPLVLQGAKLLNELKAGDKILIAEGCTHHRQCEDIGTVKLPKWIKDYSKQAPSFIFTSGTEFPSELQEYKLVIHCGACMLNSKELQARQAQAVAQGVPITNYGIAIAYMQGILPRVLAFFPEFK